MTTVNIRASCAILDPMSPADASPDRRRPYHHGSLRSALVDAGVELAREGGPDSVILREASRAAGVSHSAAYRHFADREALLREVSRHARSELAAKMRRGVERAADPAGRLGAVGAAYVDFALAQPGLFRTAFGSHPTAGDDGHESRGTREGEGRPETEEPYEILGDVLDQAQAAGMLEAHRRPGAEISAWSAVHGLACLLVDGPLPATPGDVEFALGQVLDLIGRGLMARPPASPLGSEER